MHLGIRQEGELERTGAILTRRKMERIWKLSWILLLFGIQDGMDFGLITETKVLVRRQIIHPTYHWRNETGRNFIQIFILILARLNDQLRANL